MFFGMSVHTVRGDERAFERNVMHGVATQGVHKVSMEFDQI